MPECDETRQTAVRNRDIITLMNVKYIMREVERVEARRAWQRERMTNIAQRLSWTPGGKGAPRGLDDAFARLEETDEEHDRLCREYARQIKAANRILNAISSQSMRTFVTLKYMDDTPDAEIRRMLNMTRRGLERARRAVEEAENMKSVIWRERYILAKQ